MIFSKIFDSCILRAKADRIEVRQNRKPKKCKAHITNLVREYRQLHHLEALCQTLLLWRCLPEFPLGTNKKTQRDIHRKVVRSFFYLLKSTAPEDAGFLEALCKEVNSNSILRTMIELRILESIIRRRKETLPRLKSSHYAAQDGDCLEKMWIECVEKIDGIYLRVPQHGLKHTRPIWADS